MWLLFEFYLSTDIDNITFLEDVQQPLSRHTFLKGENFVANILIKAVKIVTDTIEISEGLTYEADLNGL